MRIGGFERAAVIDRLRTIPLTPRLKKTLSQAKKSKIYSGEDSKICIRPHQDTILSRSSVMYKAGRLRCDVPCGLAC